jgi:hypothetical protein
MISDLKDVVEGFKEILQYNYSKIVIVALFFSLLFMSWKYVDKSKEIHKVEYEMKVKCDSLIAIQQKAALDIEIKYHESLHKLRDDNKREIIEYYKNVMLTFNNLSKKQKQILE